MYPLINMWKKLLTDSKGDESEYAHDAKVLYCKFKFEDIFNEKTLTDFHEWLTQSIIEGTIEWNHKTTPVYKTIQSKWFKRWKWEESSEAYADEMKRPLRGSARLIFEKRILEDTIKDFKTIDKLDKRNDELFRDQSMGRGRNDYQIAKNEETKNSVWHRIIERLDLTSEVTDSEDELPYLPVDDDPKHENQENRDFWNSILWDLVDERQ